MSNSTKPPVVAIVGPTASGKTGLAIKLAQTFSGEVISADSRQVYRSLNIGTAKITPDEMQGVPHHLLNVASLPEVYTANDFTHDATAAITAITKRDHLPIIAGGTFFYLDLLFKKTTAAPVAPNQQLRDELNSLDTTVLFTRLQKVDPERAKTIDSQNPRRLIRALEIATALGKNPPKIISENPYRTLILGIDRDREELRARFTTRAHEWLEGGLVAETQRLLDNGITRERIQELGFEYVLVLQLIDGTLTTSEWCDKFIEKNWQYAKRQRTWLQRDKDIIWIDPHHADTAITAVESFLSAK